MRLVCAALLAVVILASNVPPRVTRVTLAAMENSIDKRVIGIDANEPGYLLGPTRGVYLDGYGAVFTAEVDLLANFAPNPFNPGPTSKQDIARLKAKKQQRIAMLKVKMRDLMMSSAASLDNIPANERIALAVTIPYFRWEDTGAMPHQILMYAPKKLLVDGSRGNTAAVDAGMTVQVF